MESYGDLWSPFVLSLHSILFVFYYYILFICFIIIYLWRLWRLRYEIDR